MPIERKVPPASIRDFGPGANFDPEQDLLQINCGYQKLHVRLSADLREWIVDPSLMPEDVEQSLEQIRAQEAGYAKLYVIRVDAAVVGQAVRLSILGLPWTEIWCSNNPVTEFVIVHRRVAQIATFELVKSTNG